VSRPSPSSATPKRPRCAVYTRKSSEEGLEQGFNSLHAQREACEAYIKSQAGEGWLALAGVYDDGGFSGGSMARPGLAKLMADVDSGRIDVVVVYKVDRLTRSLTDFAKIVERFDAREVSFVSVTQAFNTTTSMGRLTLNVLLSFAQFEREVTGERIRDKIAASKAKGMWMGGVLALGYDANGRTLAIHAAEADQVRHIFARYLALGSVHALRDELEAEGLVSKRRLAASGVASGGVPFSRGALFHLLSNRLYLGEIVHKGQSHLGLHPAIIAPGLFEEVQQRLAEHAGEKRQAREGMAAADAPFTGKVFDDAGNPMSPVTARRVGGGVYRYYVSAALQLGRPDRAGSLARFPARALEDLIRDRAGKLGLAATSAADQSMPTPREAVERIDVGQHRVVITFAAEVEDGPAPPRMIAALTTGDQLSVQDQRFVLTVQAGLRRRGGSKVVMGPGGAPAVDRPRIDPALIKALARAETWKEKLQSGGASTMDALIKADGVDRAYAQRIIRLAFLAPDLKRSILEGRAPAGLTLQRLMQGGVPLLWSDQRDAVSEWRMPKDHVRAVLPR
jgi:DNA invertase Pin-like site-specific DNA recombinase